MVICNPENCKVSSSTPESPPLIHCGIPSICHALVSPPAPPDEQQKAGPPKPRKIQSPCEIPLRAPLLPNRSHRGTADAAGTKTEKGCGEKARHARTRGAKDAHLTKYLGQGGPHEPR